MSMNINLTVEIENAQVHPVEEYQDITLTVDGLNECDL